MLGGLLGNIGGKIFEAAIPKLAERAGDYAVDWLREKMQLAGIDPLTAKQEWRIKELITQFVMVKAREGKDEKD